MPSPRLTIRRLVVDGALGIDLPLEPGVNVIFAEPSKSDARLTNKAGKTALVELIQHGLGRRQGTKRQFHFAPIMEELDRLWLSVETNERPLTVQRSLRELAARVEVYEEPFSAGLRDQAGDLVGVEDLSTLLLQRLEIPELAAKTAKGDLDPLTFPLLMRAFVLHQNHSFSAILDKVQPESRRTDLLGLVSGIIPPDYFRNEEELAALQTQMQDLENRYREVSRFLRANDVPSLDEAERRLEAAEEALRSAEAVRQEIQAGIRAKRRSKSSIPGRLATLRDQLTATQTKIRDSQSELAARTQERKRIAELVGSLESDLRRLKRVQSSVRILSTVDFEICPRCTQAITEDMIKREEYGHCKLCNRQLRMSSDAPPRLVPKAPDIEMQIEEARTVAAGVESEIQQLSASLATLEATADELHASIEAETRVFVSRSVDQLVAAANSVAEKSAEVELARSFVRQAAALQRLLAAYQESRDQYQDFELALEQHRGTSKARLDKLRALFADTLEGVEYPGLQSSSIEGRSLLPLINGHYYYHSGAALTGLAVVAYHIALLRLSLAEETYYPRLLVIDSPAVGDLNEANHESILNYLARFHAAALEEADGDVEAIPWQIILTTRRMTPLLRPLIALSISAGKGKMLLRRAKNRVRQGAKRAV